MGICRAEDGACSSAEAAKACGLKQVADELLCASGDECNGCAADNGDAWESSSAMTHDCRAFGLRRRHAVLGRFTTIATSRSASRWRSASTSGLSATTRDGEAALLLRERWQLSIPSPSPGTLTLSVIGGCMSSRLLVGPGGLRAWVGGGVAEELSFFYYHSRVSRASAFPR